MEDILIKAAYFDNFNLELYINYLKARIAKL